MTCSVHHGDCLQLLQTVLENTVDVVLTDPPYSSGTRREAAKGLRKSMTRGHEDALWFDGDSLTTAGFAYLMREVAIACRRVLKPGGHMLVFIDWRMWPTLAASIESSDLRLAGMLVWDKTYFGMGSCFRNQHELILHFTKGVGVDPQRRDVGNVLSFAPIKGGDHPTEKPVDLLRYLLSVVAAPGSLILDPFCGSGTAGEAAIMEHHHFIGIEISPEYAAIARTRIAAADPIGRQERIV